MSATFSRLKNWVAEVLDYADLNAEIDNILMNLGPAGIGDYSANTGQYQLTTSPIDSEGNPTLPNSLAGEITRLRYQIQAIIGEDADFWYDAPNATLSGLSTIVYGNSVPSSRIESISSDSYVNLLVPSGTTTSLTLAAQANPIVYFVNGIRYTLEEDIEITGMSAALASNNTALVTETAESGTHASTFLGEHSTTLLIGTVGSNISSSTAQQAFKVVRGGVTEYFQAQYLNDATDGAMLEKAQRGCFFLSNGAPSSRTAINTGDTVTLQKLAWIFLKNDNTLTLTYNTPTWSFTAPSVPAIGDFWFDLTTTTWKVYSALGFNESDSVLVGRAIVSDTACVAARSTEPFRLFQGTNEVDLEVPAGGTFIQQALPYANISVYGTNHAFGQKSAVWSSANLEGGGSLAASAYYYAYVKESGELALSVTAPNDRRTDLSGYYHPSYSWRCVGYTVTSASLLLNRKLVVFSRNAERSFFSNDLTAIGVTSVMTADTATSPNTLPPGFVFTNGGTLSRGLYRKLRNTANAGALGSLIGAGDGTTTFTLPLIYPDTNWIPYTPTVAGAGVGAVGVGEYKLTGDQMEVRVQISIANAVANGNYPGFTVPTGFTIASTILFNPTTDVGQFTDVSGGPSYRPVFPTYADGSTFILFRYLVQATALYADFLTPNPVQPVGGDSFQCYAKFRVRIAGLPTLGQQKIIKVIS